MCSRVSMSLLISPLTSLLTFFFFFNDTATPEIYPLSLHDALPIFSPTGCNAGNTATRSTSTAARSSRAAPPAATPMAPRSEEHTSELQSRQYLVCRLLLEKKKTQMRPSMPATAPSLTHADDRTSRS